MMTGTLKSAAVLAVAVSVIGGGAVPSEGGPSTAAVQFTPHRAVYEIKLARASPGSGIVEMTGRMVYELSGSACEGYTQNMRFVTLMTNQNGSEQVNDLRTSSWEEQDGRRLRFNSSQYQDDRLAESTQGDAGREMAAGRVKVELAKPAKKNLALPPTVYFPMQHSIALVEAARSGKSIFTADLYDGSEKGDKFYSTSAFIGRQAPPGAVRRPDALKNTERLDALPSWPVAISYFEQGSDKKDALPVYELSFQFYDNGVTSKLAIDYGEFAIRGELAELTFLPPSTCHPAKR